MYIDSIKGSLIALVCFTVAVFVIPVTTANQAVEIVFTASTVLFAILLGFFISRLNSRFDAIKESVANEDALWLGFYKTCGIYGDAFQKRMANRIDDYYIHAFDFIGVDYYKSTAQDYFQIYHELYRVGKKYRREGGYTLLFEYLRDIEQKRNTTSVQSADQLTRGQWFTIIFLAAIVIFSMFTLRTGEGLFEAITVSLSTIVVLLLLITRDLENLRVGGRPILVESGQEVFDFIGKKRYYNQVLLTKGAVIVPENVREYRLGLHQPGAKPKIKIIKRARVR